MDKREVTVIVKASTGCGKTTIAEIIQKLLTENGFDSTHEEFEALGMDHNMTFDDRVNVVKQGVQIKIVEQAAMRSNDDQIKYPAFLGKLTK